jgi:hypothetical protein
MSKKLGGSAEWTTKEQKNYLLGRKPDLTAARNRTGAKKFAQFWADTFEGWIEKWPNDPPTEEEIVTGVNAAMKMNRLKVVSLSVYSKIV